jgi:hypothetical protein
MSNGINKFETFRYNPFRPHHSHFHREGIVEDGVTVGFEYRDYQKNAVRVFPEAHDDLDELSAMGMKILVYIFSELKKDTDEVYFDMSSFLDYANRDRYGVPIKKKLTSKVGVYNGIHDLLEKNLIARKAGESKIFYINPAKFFVGSRGKWYERMKSVPEEARKIIVDKRLYFKK